YFIENQQKSLLAAAFELPDRPVQKGDTWKVDFSCMDIRGVMTTDTIVRNLNVKAEDIYTTPEGDTMVVVTYDLYERLVATSRSYKKKGDMLTSMRVQYYGRGTFSIKQGRWVAYNAVFTLESFGMMAAKMKGVYGLMPVDDVPEVFKQD
ncbi:MAG: hypothetical protein IT270_08365, partial [Saprospiraceae bacterium]|nr:hypothetical protein [Saprospiraceae bacterium]